ncbi:MAG: multidrug efflux SMR transporter [Francisellaceae bacterium]|jgi:quaternary ammonium compound-resistance protein SugE|nr:multidrug efflux SMR transporter [Francisellaceae bacterium]MBT6538012.1 multidrug efflux SMR transporter [Francisellaceae bacterium]
MSYSWIMLLLAGFFEIFMALGLKLSYGFTKLWPSLGTAVAGVLSFYTLSQAIKVLPMGTAYAIWTGIGAAGTAIIGIFFFGESYQFLRILCLLLIVMGVLGLKIAN